MMEAGSSSRGYAGSAGNARESQVESAITRLQMVAAGVVAASEAIEQRLSNVLTPVPPVAEGANKPPREVVVSLAERLTEIGKHLEIAQRRLESVLQRIEL